MFRRYQQATQKLLHPVWTGNQTKPCFAMAGAHPDGHGGRFADWATRRTDRIRPPSLPGAYVACQNVSNNFFLFFATSPALPLCNPPLLHTVRYTMTAGCKFSILAYHCLTVNYMHLIPIVLSHFNISFYKSCGSKHIVYGNRTHSALHPVLYSLSHPRVRHTVRYVWVQSAIF